MKIRSKLIISFGLMSGVGLIVMGIMTFLLYHSILDERKLKIKSLVEITHSILIKWDKKAELHELSLEQAKKEALKEVALLRYDMDNYERGITPTSGG